MPGTIQVHRVFTAPPERVYRAFTNAEAMVKWLPPHGFTGAVQHLDVRTGGSYKMSFTNLGTGSSHSWTGSYIEVKPNELLKYADKFDDPAMPGQMQITVSFKKVFCGTDLKVTQEGIPDVIPTEMCYLGWQESLQLLGQLVAPTIPDQP